MGEMAACAYGDAGWCCGGAHGFGWPAARAAARGVGLVGTTAGRTTRRCLDGSALLAGSGSKIDFSAHVLGLRSGTSAKFERRARLIREKIIGRSMHRFVSRFRGRSP